MKKLILTLLAFLPLTAFCQTQWQTACIETLDRPETVYDNITIDKKACTITKNGKTYKLYGKIQFVENWGDIKIQIVENCPDMKIKFVDNWADGCGKFQVVDNWPELKVQIVNNWGDIKVKIVENWPGF